MALVTATFGIVKGRPNIRDHTFNWDAVNRDFKAFRAAELCTFAAENELAIVFSGANSDMTFPIKSSLIS